MTILPLCPIQRDEMKGRVDRVASSLVGCCHRPWCFQVEDSEEEGEQAGEGEQGGAASFCAVARGQPAATAAAAAAPSVAAGFEAVAHDAPPRKQQTLAGFFAKKS